MVQKKKESKREKIQKTDRETCKNGWLEGKGESIAWGRGFLWQSSPGYRRCPPAAGISVGALASSPEGHRWWDKCKNAQRRDSSRGGRGAMKSRGRGSKRAVRAHFSGVSLWSRKIFSPRGYKAHTRANEKLQKKVNKHWKLFYSVQKSAEKGLKKSTTSISRNLIKIVLFWESIGTKSKTLQNNFEKCTVRIERSVNQDSLAMAYWFRKERVRVQPGIWLITWEEWPAVPHSGFGLSGEEDANQRICCVLIFFFANCPTEKEDLWK